VIARILDQGAPPVCRLTAVNADAAPREAVEAAITIVGVGPSV
jgi:hypothetical protein